jgi:anti-sigma factor RsiW
VNERHDAITELLPWYVNDTLDKTERDLVREHLNVCDDCREAVDLLSQVQHAVRTESPAPLVPAPRNEELLAALDGRSHPLRNRWPWLAAASIAALVGVTALLLVMRDTGVESPNRFETATSPPAAEAINYVVELRIADGVGAEARTALFDALDTTEPLRAVGESTYRVTLSLGSLSLTDLEAYIEDIEARPEISKAEVIAVQLPVE